MTTPEQIQRDIEGTRRALSADVDRLSEKVSPGRVVGRRVDRVKSGASSMREKIMGSMPDPSHVTDAAGGAASSVGDAVTGAPQAVKQQTQGNPLGVGLVAFGVGLVLSSMIPATEHEKKLATEAQSKAMGPLQEKAKEMASELQPSVQQSAEQVKQVATNAASDTADQARSAAEDAKAPLQQ